MQNFSNLCLVSAASGDGLPFLRVETNSKLVWLATGVLTGLSSSVMSLAEYESAGRLMICGVCPMSAPQCSGGWRICTH